jgi:hydrogenase maturation protease
MNRARVEQIANAVLYEGYLLYPYRPSVKNTQRWTFGGLYPKAFSELQEGTDSWFSQTECLVEANQGATLSIRVRFLHLQNRCALREAGQPTAASQFDPPSTWQEAVEREVELGMRGISELARGLLSVPFYFPASHVVETPGSTTASGSVIVREQSAIAGAVEVSAVVVSNGIYKVRIRVRNDSPFDVTTEHDREKALLSSLVSTHAILNVAGGAFISLIDPGAAWQELAAGCQNLQSWPVLVGEPGERDVMLAAPIILYDYPQIAPESPGDLFDSTEIDEILTLRILTLTDQEKRAMAAVDDKAKALLERTESMAREQLMGLHGTIRGLRPCGAETGDA